MLTYTNVAASTGNQNVNYKASTRPSSDVMKYVGICCATYQKNYLCHWCPTVVSGSRRRLLPSRCPGFLLLLFGNSPATSNKGYNWCKVWPELPKVSPSYLNLLHPAEREQTVGLENRSTTISSAGLVFMSWKLVSMRDDFVWNCGGGGCYHTEEKSRMKRRRGCRGWRGSPILASRAQKITQKSLSDPQILRGVTHWLVVGT